MKTPFFHEELEVKQKFLEIARKFNQSDEIEQQLAATMLYANMAEYLAYHLLESLKQVVFSGSKAFWNGTVYFDDRESSEKLTIGQIANELKKYGFPSKDLIVPLLSAIAKNRNTIMHRMLRVPSDQMSQIDNAIAELAKDCEQLIDCIDDIYRGLPPKNITESLIPTSQHVEAVEKQNGKITLETKSKRD